MPKNAANSASIHRRHRHCLASVKNGVFSPLPLLTNSPSRGRSRHTYLSLSVISSLLKAVIVPGEERGGGGSSKGDNLGVRDECSSEDDGGAEAARVKVKEIAVPWKPQMRIKLSTLYFRLTKQETSLFRGYRFTNSL